MYTELKNLGNGWTLCVLDAPAPFHNLVGTSGADQAVRDAYRKTVKSAVGKELHAACGFSDCTRDFNNPNQFPVSCHMESPSYPNCTFLVLACKGNNSMKAGTPHTLKKGFFVAMKKGLTKELWVERPAAQVHAQEEELSLLRKEKTRHDELEWRLELVEKMLKDLMK